MIKKIENKKIIILLIVLVLLISIVTTLFLIKPKEKLGESYRIGFITDVHGYRTKKENQDITSKSRVPLLKFVEHMNKKFKPDFVVQGGDFIQGSFREGQKSIDDLKALLKYYNQLKMPAWHVIGNHETRGLTREQWMNILGYQSTYNSFQKDNLLALFLDCNDIVEERYNNLSKQEKHHYFISDGQFEWLEKNLREARDKNLKTVAFIHVPVLSHLFKKGGEKRIYPEHSQKLVKLFEEYKVLAVFAGHMEDVYYEKINGVEYFVLPGVYKTADDDNGEDNQEGAEEDWIGSFAEIYVFENQVKVRLFYKKNYKDKYQTTQIPQEKASYSIE